MANKGPQETGVIVRIMAEVTISPKEEPSQEIMDVVDSLDFQEELPVVSEMKREAEEERAKAEAEIRRQETCPPTQPTKGKRKSCSLSDGSPSKIVQMSDGSCFSIPFPPALKRSLSETPSEVCFSRRMSLPLPIGSFSPGKKTSMSPPTSRPPLSVSRSSSLSPSATFRDFPRRQPRNGHPRDVHAGIAFRSEDQPQDLSCPRRQNGKPLLSPEYPPELQLDLGDRKKDSKEKNALKKEDERDPSLKSLPGICSSRITDVLQHQIMVAETVKYPVNYPALIPLSPSVGGLGGYNTCSSSLLHPANYSPGHMMDSKASPQQQQQQQQQAQPQGPPSQGSQGGQDTPVGLGAPTNLSLPSTLELAAQLRKKEMFTQRKQREFIPESKKDESYWDRRRRNNEAAKRSREKRRFNDMILEQKVVELSKENHILKAQLNAIKDKYGILGESLVNVDQIMSTMPQADQILNKRTKFSQALLTLGSPPSVTSLLSPNGSCASSPPPPNSHFQEPESPPHYTHYAAPSQMEDHESPYDTQSQQFASSSSASDLYYAPSALNLSARTSTSSSHSPTSHMEYSPSDPELSRRSPISETGGSSLPHKLRHKSHLGDKDAAQSLLALHGIKTEPHDAHHEAAEDSVGSSDERDSGISYSSSSPCSDYHRTSDASSSSPISTSRAQASAPPQHYHPHHPHHQEHQPQQQSSQPQPQSHPEDSSLEYENTHLRSELERLASEVATLKYMFVRRPRSETDSDGSR